MNRLRIVRAAECAYGYGRGRDAFPPPAATTVHAATGRGLSLPVGFRGAIRRRINC
jgi:hypothetical protein